MNDRRSGEWGIIPKRKPRFFKLGNAWYYETREGVTRGPFDVLQEAEMDAKEYIALVTQEEPYSKLQATIND